MRILYIFPHPDDESFGPAAAISFQRRAGHEVYLLTLTRGGATKLRHKLGFSVEQMGEVRFKEMQEVARVLDLTGMTVLDLPDSGLKEMDPRLIEQVVREQIERVRPAILVSYPVHGISGFHDHLVTHAVVKRSYLELKSLGAAFLKRLAFFTIDENTASRNEGPFNLSFSTAAEIDCVLEVGDESFEAFQQSLDCYRSYLETIEKTGIRENFGRQVFFEIFQVDHDPPIDDLSLFA